MLEPLREKLLLLHRELVKNDLVSWTSGNISIRDSKTGYVLIKPSGVKYDYLTSDKFVIVSLEGKIIEGNLKPSVDLATHLFVYRKRDEINGIVHTHSTYATAFAAVGKEIPVALTALADEFGCPIPCSGYAAVGGEEIGEEIVKYCESCSAILLRQHGVFTVGKTGEDALKSAVMVESAAKTLCYAKLLGNYEALSDDEVKRAHFVYKSNYGQAEKEDLKVKGGRVITYD